MKFHLSPIAAAAVALCAQPATAEQQQVVAASPLTQVTALPDVTVDGSTVSPYKADAVQSPKFTQPLRETPQTIQIITSEVFTQQGATTLTEALRNSPGVGTFYAGENGNTTTGDAIYMRGFDTSNSIFVDGIRDLGSISRDVFNIEQIEVIKGPAGTDYGRTAPTGSVNLATKQAHLGNAVSGLVSVGSDGQRRAQADLNQTLGSVPGAALRLNTLWQDSDLPHRDHVNNSRVGIAPSLGLGLDGATRAYVNLLYVRQDNVPDGFVPTIGLPGWTPQPGLEALAGNPVDPHNFYGTRHDHDDSVARMATARIEHDLSDTLRLTNTTRWGQTEQDYLLTAFMSTGGVDDNGEPSGNIGWTDPDDLSTYTLNRSLPTIKDQVNEILTNQLNLRADLGSGAIRHTLSTGLEVIREEQTAYGNTATGTVPPASLYAPDWDAPGTLSISRNGGAGVGRTDTVAVYVFDTVRFGERFIVTGGLRADRYQTEYRNTTPCGGTGRGAVDCGDLPQGTLVETINAEDDDTLFNWKLGALYKPVETASVYINYAISQQPPGGSNFQFSTSTNSLDRPNLDPQKAATYELGTKWDVLDEMLSLNLALFRTEVTNEINADDTDENGVPRQTGEKRVEGIEILAVGNLTRNWSVSAGYSHLSTSVEAGRTVTADGSENLTYTPDASLTGWTAYRFPFGLLVGGGVRHTDGLRRGTDGAVGTPTYTESYTVVDAVVAYAFSPQLALRVNGYNLADEDYVASINKSGYRYMPGASRTFLFSADFRF